MLQHIEDFDGPQFKCIYLPNVRHTATDTVSDNICAFVFVFNHAIIDGMSTMATLRKFRILLNEIVSGKMPSIQPWPKMHPPCDFFFQRAVNALPEEVRKQMEAIPPLNLEETFFKPKPCLFIERKCPEAVNDPTIPPGQGLTIRTFTEEETKSFRLACRSHNTTIQGAAQIAGSVAMAEILQNSDEWETLKIKYNLALNLRPHVAKEVSVDYTGLYVSILFGFDATVGPEINAEDTKMSTFWKLAQESTGMITEQVKNQAYLQSFFALSGLADQLPVLDSVDLSASGTEGRSDEILYTTSYGAWDFPSASSDKIKPLMVYTNSSVHVVGPVFSQQLITVNGKFSWTIGWSKRVVSEETAEKFASIMFKLIENAIKGC